MASAFPSPPSPAAAEEKFYKYDPVLGLAIASTVVFSLLAVLMFFVNLRFKPHKFMHWLVVAALGEVLGFAIRIVSIDNTSKTVFVITTLFLLLMPNFIALVNYIACGKMMAFSDLNVGCLRPASLARIFFISDFLSFCIQGMGGGFLAGTTKKSQDLGKAIIITGLVCQSLALFLFLWVTTTIHRQPRYKLAGRPDAKLMFIGLYLTTALLFIRSIFRLIEYAAGTSGYLYVNEWPFYVFDTLAIMAAFVVYSVPIVHFGRCLNALAEELALDQPSAGDIVQSNRDLSIVVIRPNQQVAPSLEVVKPRTQQA